MLALYGDHRATGAGDCESAGDGRTCITAYVGDHNDNDADAGRGYLHFLQSP